MKLNDNQTLIHEADPRLARAVLYTETPDGEDEESLYLKIKGREATCYSDKELIIRVTDTLSPLMVATREIDRAGLEQAVEALHKRYLDTNTPLAALTGLKEWSSSEEDLWLYQGENNANNVMQIYGCYFTNYSFKPVDTNDLRLMTLEEVTTLAKQYNRQRFIKPVVQIDEERYNEMLNILPPQRWEGGVFHISEALVGDIHSMFCKIGDDYFEGARDITETSTDDFRHECLMLLAEDQQPES